MTYTYTMSAAQITLFILLLLWGLIWTGIALWRSAQRNQLYWFVAMLIVNTVGVLPIIYLILTRAKKSSTDECYLKAPLVNRG